MSLALMAPMTGTLPILSRERVSFFNEFELLLVLSSYMRVDELVVDDELDLRFITSMINPAK